MAVHCRGSAEIVVLRHCSVCSLCIALFSPSLLVVEEEWRHPAVQPCCHSVQAPPFWLWLLQSVLCCHRGGLIYLAGRLREEKGDFPCCCRIQLSALRETIYSVDPLLFLSPSTFLNGPRYDGGCFTAALFPLRKWVFIQCFGALSQKSGFKVAGGPPQKDGGASSSHDVFQLL